MHTWHYQPCRSMYIYENQGIIYLNIYALKEDHRAQGSTSLQ